jgi:hypothetical protein
MRKYAIPLLVLMVLGCGSASAEKRKIAVAIRVGAFFPSSSRTSDAFGGTWTNLEVGLFKRVRPDRWRFTADLTRLHHSDVGEASLYPLTAGMVRGFGGSARLQPYTALRLGPYYGTIDGDGLGVNESTFGFNANAAVGVIFRDRYALEARYDYFSRFGGFSFSGVSIGAKVRVFDLKL